MTDRCQERIWDNGDTTGCGRVLPCADHPPEDVEAKKRIAAIHRVLDEPYKLGERPTDRLRAVAVLAAEETERLRAEAADALGLLGRGVELFGGDDEKIRELRAWARSRIEECRAQELKFGSAWQLREKHQHGPPQALVEAWSERRALEAVLRILDGGNVSVAVADDRSGP